MKNGVWKLLLVILFVLAIVFGTLFIIDTNRMKNNKPVLFSTWGKKYSAPVASADKMNVVLSLEDKIADDTVWCGTFNLIWNDLKNELAKKDIEFTPQLDVVRNLNKGTFNTECLSEDSYYKVYGKPTIELKKQIEKEIKRKFNETSDILDDFNWNESGDKDYFLYSMLKKEFEFPKVFDRLEKGKFKDWENVKYFGIKKKTSEKVREQVKVLYYNSKEDFAIKLLTKSNDEVIISRGNKANTFGEIYAEIKENNENFKGSKNIEEDEIVKIPNIDFKLKKEFNEIEAKPFLFASGEEYAIEKAVQTIEFSLDEKGGRVKSEAGMVNKTTALLPDLEPREFLVNDTFCIFLKEKDKELPYFAAKISDITQVQIVEN